MVTQITLGNIYQSGGKTVVGGSASGIDSESLIKALVEARRLPAVRLEDKNKTIDAQQTALTSLKSLMARFKTAVDTLRNPPGVQNASQNIFEYRTATMSSLVLASNYLNVTVEPGAATQTIHIDEIEQLAKEAKQETGIFQLPDITSESVVMDSGSPTAGFFTEGSFTMAVRDGGADAVITLEEGDSLQAVANKFNAVKNRTGMQATILKVANGTPNNSYKIVFTGLETGATNGFDFTATPGVGETVTADGDGVLGQISFNNIQTAQNAKFTLDGVDIERETNSVADLIDGITFTLKQPLDDATPIEIAIEPDTEIVKNALTQLADVYNEFRLFAAKQNELGDDGLPLEDAVLSNNTAFRTIMSQIAAEVNHVVGGISGGDPERLADIGITFKDYEGDEENPFTRNIMVIDEEKLKSALEANFNGVRGVFEYQMSADNANLITFKRTNELSISSFSLNIDHTNGIYEATYTDPDTLGPVTITLDATVSGGNIVLKGQKNTALAGLELIYTSLDDATVNVTITQGVGDRLYNAIDSITSTQGTLTNALKALETQTDRNEEEITKIDEQINRYREQLIDQYARLEAALTQANQLLALLDAQAGARESA